MELFREYGVQTDIYFPLIKAGSQNFATSSDYTYAAGDIKISKDGGAAANPTNSPSAITMGNGAMWKLTLTATEMQAALIAVTVVDAATKAVEDQMILISTYGNASAQHEFNLNAALTAGGIANAVLDGALSEPSGVFTWAGASLRTVIAWIGLLSRNKLTQDDTETVAYADDGTTPVAEAPITKTGSTLTRGEWINSP